MAGFRPRFTTMCSDGIVIWRFESETLIADAARSPATSQIERAIVMSKKKTPEAYR
jgi:hypothetical protein